MAEAGAATNVRVAVRCRPFNSREKGMNEVSCVQIVDDNVYLTNPIPGGEKHSFAFDVVFGDNSVQPSVWEKVGAPILESSFSGYNGTIFAYGQTGSGKTWSMQGGEGDLEGIIPRMNKSLFGRILEEKTNNSSIQFLVTASYFEIYNEVLFDLLDPSNRKAKERSGLEIKEHPVLGVYVKGLQEIVVDSPQKIQGLLDQGMSSRTVASTQMNADSSRSHSVFTIKIHKKDLSDESRNIFAKINLVDLAGSERVKSTGATGATLKEGANINKSLSALGNVINALVEAGKGKKGVFIPYRNSKLTRVLQESLGGNSITAMLAAMSPAACNFDETMSTLKYADRAKSIKVKAVKNEEANQISKLNDEIRALKERLLKEGGGGGQEQVDTSALEEKHRQQLQELEEAMKSTWEEKARISSEHEVERQRLQKEQEAAMKDSKRQKERSWQLLEEKRDIDLALSHVRDAVKKDSDCLSDVTQWQNSLKNLSKLEQQLGEQDTVVDVYRTSLQKDSQSVLKAPPPKSSSTSKASPRLSIGGSNVPLDKSTLSMWKQLKDKFTATLTEIVKWTKLQEDVTKCVDQMLSIVQSSDEKWTKNDKEDREKEEMIRGFELIKRLLINKKDQVQSDISRTRAGVISSAKMAQDMMTMLSLYDKEVQTTTKAIASEGLNVETVKGLVKGIATALGELKNCVDQYVKATPRESRDDGPGAALSPRQYSVSGSQKGPNKGGSNPIIGGKDMFLFDSSGTEPGFAQINLKSVQKVSGISLQGVVLEANTVAVGDALTLPCGLTLETCRGDTGLTQTAMGDIIDWVSLLKKNPPEKFLKRPPVRFLFDLMKFVGETTGLFPASITGRQWESISDSKQAKIEFIDEILTFISNYLNIPAATNSNSIITGAEADLTNIFIQHVAIAAYKHKSQGSSSSSPRPTGPIWLTDVRVMWSVDGSSFSQEDVHTTLQTADDVQMIQLAAGVVSAKVIRIVALKWSGPVPAARFSIHTLGDDSQGCVVTGEELIGVITSMKQSSVVFIGSLEFLSRVEDARKAKAQEDVRKRMDTLANEKAALENTLATEKQALTSAKQGLEQQLDMCKKQLRETESLFKQEQSLREQLEGLHATLEREKTDLQNTLQTQIDQNATHENELLKLQSTNTKNEMLIENLTRQLAEQEELVSQLKSADEDHIAREQQLESEKEDLSNDIAVLREERDLARSNEEDLDMKLKMSEEELNELQESYVATTERCNEFQDDLLELTEKLEDYKNALKQKEALSLGRPNTGHANANPLSQSINGTRSSPRQTEKSPGKIIPVPPVVNNAKPPPAPATKGTATAGDEDDDYEDEFED